MPSIIAVVLLLFLPTCLVAWKQYDYFSNPTDKWKQLDRRGHSLVLMNESQVILFGGRGSDSHRPQIQIDGVLEFATHDNMPLSSNYTPNNPKCKPVETCIPLSDSENDNEVCSYSWDYLIHNTSQNEQVKIEEACGFVPGEFISILCLNYNCNQLT